MSFSIQQLDVNGAEVKLLTAGSGDPVVIFHGAGTFSGFDAALALADKYRVIVPYHPGWGMSGDAPWLNSLHDYVVHYLDLFDQLGLNKVRLIGFSMGGWLASKFAIEHTHRLHKLVLVAPAGLDVDTHSMADFSKLTPPEIFARLTADPSILAKHIPMPPPDSWVKLREREGCNFGRMLAAGHPEIGRAHV